MAVHIIVNRADDVFDLDDGGCTLRVAIFSANYNSHNLSIEDCAIGEDQNALEDLDTWIDQVIIDVDEPIQLTNGDIWVTDSVRIRPADDAGPATILADEGHRHFKIFDHNSTDQISNEFYIVERLILKGGEQFDDGGNEEDDFGGSILIGSAQSLRVSETVFENNHARYGGAIAVKLRDTGLKLTELYLKDSVFTNNSNIKEGVAVGFGGAVYLGKNRTVGDARLENNVFKGNRSGLGGAIYLIPTGYGPWLFVNNQFVDNHAIFNPDFCVPNSITFCRAGAGGAIYVRNASTSDSVTITVRSNVFTHNTAETEGGAISAQSRTDGILRIEQSTFAFNAADKGDAIGMGASDWEAHASTFIHNSAMTSGSQIYMEAIHSNRSSSLILRNNIIQNGMGANNCDWTEEAGTVLIDGSLGYSIDSDGTCVTDGVDNNLVADAKLSGIQTDDHGRIYFEPTADSPAIDLYPDDDCVMPNNDNPFLDQLGNPRKVDGVGDGVERCDVGAIEVQYVTDLIYSDQFG